MTIRLRSAGLVCRQVWSEPRRKSKKEAKALIPTVKLGRTEEQVPALGLGTWKMGLDPAQRDKELEALRKGIEAGVRLIDTAEIYSEGEAERMVGEVIKDLRDEIFLVTKVWPTHATSDGVRRAAEGSLKRLGTDRIDLYLLHWPSAEHPITETMKGMRALVEDGIVRYVGVSNFSAELVAEAQEALGDIPIVCNQVVYHLKNRVVERSVKPYCDKHQVTIMAYSPLGAGNFPEPGTPGRAVLDAVAEKHGRTPYQVALNWLVCQDNVIVIPKAATAKHAVENAAALDFELSAEEIEQISSVFPVPDEDFKVRRM